MQNAKKINEAIILLLLPWIIKVKFCKIRLCILFGYHSCNLGLYPTQLLNLDGLYRITATGVKNISKVDIWYKGFGFVKNWNAKTIKKIEIQNLIIR